ncbi:MAG: histidine ammonia-lyase [Chloroflexi bacterium]|nr:histidine ammonia-lyase [Chloroflexota bacterium]
MSGVTIDGRKLTIDEVVVVAREAKTQVALAEEAKARIQRSRQLVERLVESQTVVYGITTGFGALKGRFISPEHSQELQRNLVMSHAVGVGEPLPEEVVRAMLLIRANTLARGYSGIRLETLEALIAMLNRGVHPVIPAKGSVGASGDLAPLAHLALVLMGQGEALYRGRRLPGGEALRSAGLEPIALAAKEGLALINGTTAMAALGALAVHDALGLCDVADVAGALSLEALAGVLDAFDPRLHALRPHLGQQESAANVLRLTQGSQLVAKPGEKVQDPYCLRCIPQVHGAVRDAVEYARRVISIELNSAIDNPLIFSDGETTVISGGNFHGEPLALALDFLGIAVAELASISERRLDRLLNSDGLLPPFLSLSSGLNSGFMTTQYTAAALVSENKVLAHPASVDSIPTSGGVEDHVSMGTISARKAREIIENTQAVLALELMAAAQGVDLRWRTQEGGRENRQLKLGPGTRRAYDLIRARVPYLERDEVLYPYIEAVKQLVASGRLRQALS